MWDIKHSEHNTCFALLACLKDSYFVWTAVIRMTAILLCILTVHFRSHLSQVGTMSDTELPPPILGDDDVVMSGPHVLGEDEPELPPPVSDDELSLPPSVDDESDEVQPDLPPPPSVGGHCNCKKKRCNFMFTPEFIENMRQEQKYVEKSKNKRNT